MNLNIYSLQRFSSQKLHIFLLCFGILFSCETVTSLRSGYGEPRTLRQDPPNEMYSVAKGNSDFTRKLYTQLKMKTPESDNLVVSPFSITSLLAMVIAGAKGKTLDEIRLGLSAPEPNSFLSGLKEALGKLVSNENFILEIANSLYVQAGFDLLDSYIDKVKTNLAADAVKTDFSNSHSARSLINNWAEKKTHGKITNIIKENDLGSTTKLVLVNAVYFKGDWATRFSEGATKKDKFYLENGEVVQVDMMHTKSSFRMAQVPELDATALELPYKGDRIIMILILPKQNLKKTEASLESLDLTTDFKFEDKVKVMVNIPKFKIESSHDLKDVLKALGMNSMFNDGSADFSDMTRKSQLSVSSVVQKAFIEVNEQGSEAAAASAGMMMMRALILTPEFVCNKPFMYFIKDKTTGLILFAGRVSNPLK